MRYVIFPVFALTVVLSTVSAQDLAVLPNALAPLTTPTPDGSGQVTEPSIVQFPLPWHGFKYWMALAPYPHNDAADENPSILVSNDGQHWSIPPGVSNPIERPAPLSHLADSSLFFDRVSDQLWVYYISEDQFHFSNVMRTISPDGMHWSIPELVIRAPDYQIVMPAIAKIGEQYWLWSVNAGNAGCSASSTFVQYRTSVDGVNWSAPLLADIAQPGYRIWHIGVMELRLPISNSIGTDKLENDDGVEARIPASPPENRPRVASLTIYGMLASAYVDNCGHADLFLALSRDGVHWAHFARPLLTPNSGHWDGAAIYKSTMAWEPTTSLMTVWYSAWTATEAGADWHVGVSQGDFWHTFSELSK
jgi:hypothetical protein